MPGSPPETQIAMHWNLSAPTAVLSPSSILPMFVSLRFQRKRKSGAIFKNIIASFYYFV
jgi:hypothetical protein